MTTKYRKRTPKVRRNETTPVAEPDVRSIGEAVVQHMTSPVQPQAVAEHISSVHAQNAAQVASMVTGGRK